jgi:hypothetical protein
MFYYFRYRAAVVPIHVQVLCARNKNAVRGCCRSGYTCIISRTERCAPHTGKIIIMKEKREMKTSTDIGGERTGEKKEKKKENHHSLSVHVYDYDDDVDNNNNNNNSMNPCIIPFVALSRAYARPPPTPHPSRGFRFSFFFSPPEPKITKRLCR